MCHSVKDAIPVCAFPARRNCYLTVLEVGEFSGPHLWGDENVTSLLVLLSSRYICDDLLVFWTEYSSAQGGYKGRKLFSYSTSFSTMWSPAQTTTSIHCVNVATHLTFKQEVKVGRKHTVRPNDDISKGDWNITNNAPFLNWYEARVDLHTKNYKLQAQMLSLQSTKVHWLALENLSLCVANSIRVSVRAWV